jgi:hypothetical protein
MKKDVESGRSIQRTRVCVFEGFTDVSVFVFVGKGFDAEQCDSCQAPPENSTDRVAYYFELSCTPICETLSPTSGPIETVLLYYKIGASVDKIQQTWFLTTLNCCARQYVRVYHQLLDPHQDPPHRDPLRTLKNF